MIIDPVKKLKKGNDLFLQYPLKYSQKRDILWYSINCKYAEFVTDLLDGPLVALLIPAMVHGEDIHINGAISERLFYNLKYRYQILLTHLVPTLKPITIHPDNIIIPDRKSKGVATGFSCGIDTFCLLGEHHYSAVPESFKVTHLLFNNVGSHGHGGERLFNERYKKNKVVAEKIRLPLIKVNSNLDQFYSGFRYSHTDTPRNASVPLLLQNGIGRYLYASAYSYPDTYVKPDTLMTHCDPTALPLLSTEAVDMLTTGSEYTRVEKTLRVANIEDSYSALDVCIHPGSAGNCSQCSKCLRTLLTLEIAGLLEKYSSVFDLSKYREQRTRYIGEVIFSEDPFLQEIREFAKHKDYKFPIKSYIIGIYLKVQNQFKNIGKFIRELICKAKRIIMNLDHNHY